MPVPRLAFCLVVARVQEAELHQRTVPRTAARWHMIGHLQRNKVKPILPLVDLVHSVDSLRLAEEIEVAAGVTPSGILLALGSVLGGFAFYVLDGRMRYVHNLYGKERHAIE